MDYDRMHGDILRAFADSNGIASRQRYFGGRYSPAADAFFDERTRELVARFELPGVTEHEELVQHRAAVAGIWDRFIPTREINKRPGMPMKRH